jgi:choline-phosphate cytidylyltransferase
MHQLTILSSSSEEDNDPLTDDGASAVSIPIVRHSNANTRSHSKPSRPKHHLASSLLSDDGVDSPTYDGDIESSTTAGPNHHPFQKSPTAISPHHHHTSSTSTLGAPITHIPSNAEITPVAGPPRSTAHPVFISQTAPLRVPEEPAHVAVTKDAFNPANLTPEEIAAFVQKATSGDKGRKYKINAPPTDRPVRVYADGLSHSHRLFR